VIFITHWVNRLRQTTPGVAGVPVREVWIRRALYWRMLALTLPPASEVRWTCWEGYRKALTCASYEVV